MITRPIGTLFVSLTLAACSLAPERVPGSGHIIHADAKAAPDADIPAPVQDTVALPRPQADRKAETYSISVINVPVRDLLFAMARDARLNVDIHAGITGNVTLNAVDQTLPQLLTRIARQVDMRFEIDGPNLSVMPDTPFLRHYPIDYVNLGRKVTGALAANTQIATGPALPGGGSTAATASGNVSSALIEDSSANRFWEQLEKNIKDILHETDKILPEGSSETVVEQASTAIASGTAALPAGHGSKAAQTAAGVLAANPNPTSASQGSGTTLVRRSTFREAAAVIVNAESGVVAIRATQRQHEKIREFIDRVVDAARRQVMIEATIVEVQLSDGYEQGVDWTRLIGSGKFELRRASGILSSGDAYNMKFTGNSVQNAAIQLLESFGTVKVLSSPRLSALNNQTALLKVVENVVYFNVKSDTTVTASVGTSIAVTTTPQSVSVGLVLTVTPQISDDDFVILGIRPTISGVSGLKEDPNPANKTAGVRNFVPQIRTREIESVMRVASGDIAVLGGLMEDGIDYRSGRIPLLGQLPLLGELFTTRGNSSRKSELVIFLRPVVVREASLASDYAALSPLLPERDFLQAPSWGRPPAVGHRPPEGQP